MATGSTFKERVLKIVRAIPKGKVLTYGEVARRAGNEKAARAVGRIMNSNRSSEIPCHRVVAANGLGGYNRGEKKKRAILKSEGVLID